MNQNKPDFYCDEILSGKIKIKKEYESDTVLAFYHTKPSYKIHIVIIPKEHIESLLTLKEKHNDLLIEIINVAKDLAKSFPPEDGIRLVTNAGKFQDCPHLHFHLISGDKIK